MNPPRLPRRAGPTLLATLSLLAMAAPLALGHDTVVPPNSGSDYELDDLNFFPPGVDGPANGEPWNCRQFPQGLPDTEPPAVPAANPNFTVEQTYSRYFAIDAIEYIGGGASTFIPGAFGDPPVARHHLQYNLANHNLSKSVRGPPDNESAALSVDGFVIVRFPAPVLDVPGDDLKIHMHREPVRSAHFCAYGSMQPPPDPPGSGPNPTYTFIGSAFTRPAPQNDGVYFDLSRFYSPFAALNADPADDLPSGQGQLQYLLIEASHTKHPQIQADFTWFSDGLADPPVPNQDDNIPFTDASENFGHPLWGNGNEMGYDDESPDPITGWEWTIMDSEGKLIESDTARNPRFSFPLPSDCQNATVDQCRYQPPADCQFPLSECPFHTNPHTVCLIVTTRGRIEESVLPRQDDACKPIIVYNIRPKSNFTWDLVSGMPGLIQFHDLSRDPDAYQMPANANPATGLQASTGLVFPTSPAGDLDAWEWDFNYGEEIDALHPDPFRPEMVVLRATSGFTTAMLNPTYQYLDDHPHLVALRVTDVLNATWRKSDTFFVTVFPRGLPPEGTPALDHISDIRTTEGTPLTLRFCATDQDHPNPADLTFEFYVPPEFTGPGGPLYDLRPATLSPMSYVDEHGCFSIPLSRPLYGRYNGLQITVRDPDGNIATQRFSILVQRSTGDADGDGVPDNADTCPQDFNPRQVGPCRPVIEGVTPPTPPVDTDGDGIFHSEGELGPKDNCPDDPNPGQDDLDGDRIGNVCDTDRDGDDVPEVGGLHTTIDNCPLKANADQVDADGDGVGDACQRGDRVGTDLSGAGGTNGGKGGQQVPDGGEPALRGPTRAQGLALSLSVLAATALLVAQTIRMRRARPPSPPSGGTGGGPQP